MSSSSQGKPRKEGGGKAKEMAPKVAKPVALSAEAAAMEQKLADLRKAMGKERAKREALMANMGGGSLWRNGGTSGGLRANVKGKGAGDPAPTSGSAGASSSNRRPVSGEAAPSGGPPSQGLGAAGVFGAAPAPHRSSSAARAAASTSSDGSQPMPAVSGSRVTTGTRPAAPVGSAKPKTDILDLQAGGGGGGMSCGTDDGPSLASGAFSEADSHRSFLEALNEWRKASRGDTPADAGTSHGTASTGNDAAPRPRSAAAAVSSSSLDVQTEARPVSARPSSAKPLSYFDKLVINTNSRQAGHLAAGEPPETLSRSISAQSSAVFRPSSASAKDKPPGTPPIAAPAPTASAAAAPASKFLAAAAAKAEGGDEAADLAAAAAAAAADPMSILDRLEALERQRQAAVDEPDEEGDTAGSISVTTAQGMVLTKGVRLPDEVLIPPTEAC